MAWITTSDLRDQAGAKQAIDETKFVDAVETACAEVEKLCGPIAWARITDEYVEAAGSDRACLKARVTRELVSVTTAAGVALDLTTFRVDGQVLARRDHRPIGSDLLVTYDTGYFDDTLADERAPLWARRMAVLIAHQSVRVDRRTRLSQSDDEDLTGTGYLIPNAALAIGSDYLLWRGGVA